MPLQPPASPPPFTGTAHVDPAEPRRVLVVLDEALTRRVEAAVSDDQRDTAPVKVATTPSFLAAMGDLAQQPADAVVGPIRAISGMIAATAKALRDLAPEARLIIVAEGPDQPEASEAIRSGFDFMLVEPIESQDLRQALLAPQPMETPFGDSSEDLASTQMLWSGIDAKVNSVTNRPQTDPMETVPTGATWPYQADSDTSPAQLVPDEQLGDVDLIDHMLVGQQDFERQPMRIIRAQSGIEGIAWTGEPQTPDFAVQTSTNPHEKARLDSGHQTNTAPPSEHCRAPVTYHGQDFGQLHAPPPAETDHLEPWAQWLARWLGLDHQLQQLKTLTMRDELTGVWNRRYFNHFLSRILDRARRERQQVTLMVFDIDDFKQYNDRFGHGAGDEILRETARLMQSVVRDHDVVARIGGDEFAVIFWDAQQPRHAGSEHPHDVMRAAKRFRQAVSTHRFPKLAEQAHGTLTVSAGLVGYPWDGQAPEQLLELADAMAMQSKRQGKNVITYGPGAAQHCRAGGLDPSQSNAMREDHQEQT